MLHKVPPAPQGKGLTSLAALAKHSLVLSFPWVLDHCTHGETSAVPFSAAYFCDSFSPFLPCPRLYKVFFQKRLMRSTHPDTLVPSALPVVWGNWAPQPSSLFLPDSPEMLETSPVSQCKSCLSVCQFSQRASSGFHPPHNMFACTECHIRCYREREIRKHGADTENS